MNKAANLLFEYGYSFLVVSCATLFAFLIHPHFELTNLVMVYLLGTLLVAMRGHRGPAALSSTLSVLCFDFFFVPPRFTFSVSDSQYVLTFVVMFTVAMIISHLVIRLRIEAETAREEERRSVWLMEKAKKAEIEAETEHLRSSLLSSVSHDFRTPLAAIVGSATTLLEKEELQKSKSTQELLENIATEGERLSRLVQNLLEATRFESGVVRIQKEKYPLEEVVGSALARLEKVLENREVTVSIPEECPAIPMDGLLIEQVLINLVENAVRHTPSQTRIQVDAKIENDFIVVSVSDNGSGLKEEDLERVFDKFYHDKASGGAGLGLAICRAIINAHGGRIWAENKNGAHFRFTLPWS